MTDEKRPAPGQVTWKSQSIGDKKRILSTFRENKTGHTKNQKTATLEARRQWREIFNNWKENGFQPWIWCPANLANQELEEHKPIFPTSKFSENSPPGHSFSGRMCSCIQGTKPQRQTGNGRSDPGQKGTTGDGVSQVPGVGGNEPRLGTGQRILKCWRRGNWENLPDASKWCEGLSRTLTQFEDEFKHTGQQQ